MKSATRVPSGIWRIRLMFDAHDAATCNLRCRSLRAQSLRIASPRLKLYVAAQSWVRPCRTLRDCPLARREAPGFVDAGVERGVHLVQVLAGFERNHLWDLAAVLDGHVAGAVVAYEGMDRVWLALR